MHKHAQTHLLHAQGAFSREVNLPLTSLGGENFTLARKNALLFL